MPLPADSPRAQILDEAKGLILGDRNAQYGPPTQDFERSAQILNAQGYRGPGGRLIEMHDVALMVIAIKLSRLVWTPGKRDSWADIAGYVGCGWECVVEEEKARAKPKEKHHLIWPLRWLGRRPSK
jgi:hypothetical protein